MSDDNELAGIGAHMATTTLELLLGRLMPNEFMRGDNIEEFLKECNRYFDAAQASKKLREHLIKTLLDRELLKDYETVDESIVGYEARLRAAFKKQTN